MNESEIVEKRKWIEKLRANGFNCFPIPKGKKSADGRYKAETTLLNQVILDEENFGYIAIRGAGTLTIDFDHPTLFEKAIEKIKQKYVVFKSPHGYHVPVTGVSGQIEKIELFDYSIRPTKLVEIQGAKHYCVGVGSMVIGDKKHNDEGAELFYTSIGTDLFWNIGGADFHSFIDGLCIECNLAGKKEDRIDSHNLRLRFLSGESPIQGTSNNYFFQAALTCNTDGLSEEEAREKIKLVYDKWANSSSFSGRLWNNIDAKIKEVYEKNLRIEKGRPKEKKLNTLEIAEEFIAGRKFFKNQDHTQLYENVNGFLEKVSKTLQSELQVKYPELNQNEYNDIIFKLIGLAQPYPNTNKDLIVFKNGIFNHREKRMVTTNDIADMGFKDYNYLEPLIENEPTEFLKTLFSNVADQEHPRIKAGLNAIKLGYLDPKISVIYGASGVGKSTPLTILTIVLGEYAMTVEMNQFLSDKFIKAKIKDKRLLVFQDLPSTWKDFTTIKTITGEQQKTERGFHQDVVTFDNKIKIWASGNYLAKIPPEEQDAMYTRRLSLVHNTRTVAYKEDPLLATKIVKDEGEKIISWIVNIKESECAYEPKSIIKSEWENIASPETEYIEKHWQYSESTYDVSVMKIVADFKEKYQTEMSVKQMEATLKAIGYSVKYGIVKGIEPKLVKEQRVNTL